MNPAPKRQKILRYLTPRIEDALFYETDDKSRKEHPPFGTPHPDTVKYPKHVLCHIEGADDTGDIHHMWYIIPPEFQDEYNWEYTQADIGGTKFDAVKRTYVTLREDFDPTDLAMGAVMPNVPEDRFSTSYVLAERREMRSGDRIIDNLFVVEERVYVLRVAIRSLGFDDLCRKVLTESESLYYSTEVVTGTTTAAQLFAAPTNAYWGMQSDGVVREGKQLSSEWYLIVSKQVMAGTFTDGVMTIDSIEGNKDYYWPPVLQYIEFMDWEKRKGGADTSPRITYSREAYRGPCKSLTTRSWSATAVTSIPVCDQLLSNGGSYSSPFFSISLPDCLHGQLAFQCDIGNNDPDYTVNVGSLRILLATNETDWPADLTVADDQEPFRGGYLRTTIKVYSPTATGGGAVNTIVPVPTGLAASAITATGFDLDWTADAEATQYLVEVALDAAFTQHVVYRTETTNAATITGLTTGTAYWSRVSTLRGFMFSLPGATVTTTTS